MICNRQIYNFFITKTTEQHKTTGKRRESVKERTKPRQDVCVWGAPLLLTPQARTHSYMHTYMHYCSHASTSSSHICTQETTVSLGSLCDFNVSCLFPLKLKQQNTGCRDSMLQPPPPPPLAEHHGTTLRRTFCWRTFGVKRGRGGGLVRSWSCMYRCWYFKSRIWFCLLFSHRTQHRERTEKDGCWANGI